MMMITITKPESMPSLGSTKLLTYSSSKIEKSNNTDLGYLTAIMYLAPAELSGWNVCQNASDGCKDVCLNTAGRGRFDNVQLARIKRTQFFFLNRQGFIDQLIKEIDAHIRKAQKLGLKPAVRLNGTSDIPWERVKIESDKLPEPYDTMVFDNIMDMYSDVTFYDYTKYPYEKRPAHKLPANYHLTFSLSEECQGRKNDGWWHTNLYDVLDNLRQGRNVAVVFDEIPEYFEYFGYVAKCIDGDKHDMRFLDSVGVIVGLKAKGKAKKDRSGFVWHYGSNGGAELAKSIAIQQGITS